MAKYTLHHGDLPASVYLHGNIAVDTESMGLNILRDKLCLVQLCDENGAIHLVKFDLKNYSAPNLKALLQDESRIKIFHFARADVGTLMHHLGINIEPIFCTKIASRLTRTYTQFHGLKSLVRELLDVELEKESQTSFWGAAELTHKQLNYAATDVLYLHKMMAIFQKRLELSARTEIAQGYFDAMTTICKCDILQFDPAEILNH
jgi:ribonuclease D